MERMLNCPFCGSQGIMMKIPLWSGSHGYHGCYDFFVKCSNSDCAVEIPSGRRNSIYESEEVAEKKAIEKWNSRC